MELVRRLQPNSGGGYGSYGSDSNSGAFVGGDDVSSTVGNNDAAPEKVMRIVPSGAAGGGVVSFQVESGYENSGSMGIDVQLGEFQVMREIMKSSLPALVGWPTQLGIAMQRSVDEALRQGGADPAEHHQRGGGGHGRVPF